MFDCCDRTRLSPIYTPRNRFGALYRLIDSQSTSPKRSGFAPLSYFYGDMRPRSLLSTVGQLSLADEGFESRAEASPPGVFSNRYESHLVGYYSHENPNRRSGA